MREQGIGTSFLIEKGLQIVPFMVTNQQDGERADASRVPHARCRTECFGQEPDGNTAA